ncbi:MAG: 30S ribosomal protein S3, partial [Erysipelotrichaceae bacterium]
MGQKVSPIGLRVGVIRDWESRWYAEKEYGTLLQEDIKIRELIEKDCKDCMISRIEIERVKNSVQIIIRTARPGNFVGQDGAKIEALKKSLVKLTKKTININVVEVANPDLDARLVAQKIARMLEDRQSFRTAQKKAIQATMRAGAKGIKTAVSGRLGGADIARTEGYSEGVTPLHTLRSDIDYAWEEAMTTYGKLGVKVWICRGEVLPGEMVKEPEKPKMNPNNRNKRNFRN